MTTTMIMPNPAPKSRFDNASRKSGQACRRDRPATVPRDPQKMGGAASQRSRDAPPQSQSLANLSLAGKPPIPPRQRQELAKAPLALLVYASILNGLAGAGDAIVCQDYRKQPGFDKIA
jgi:hypothetical protein